MTAAGVSRWHIGTSTNRHAGHLDGLIRMRSFLYSVPLFVPGVVVSVIIARLASRRVARALGTHPWVAWALVASLGLIASATLTPLRGALAEGIGSSGACDLGRLSFAPLTTYLRPNETSANVALFVPLGLALAMLPRSRRTVACVAAALALPFLVEGTQLLVPALGRGCEGADMVDNLAGLLLGLTAGVALRRIVRGPSGRPS